MGLTEFLLVLAVGGGIVAVLFATFKGAAGAAESGEAAALGDVEDRGGGGSELEERYQAALRSLEEIESDYEAGNLSDTDFEELRQRYQTRVAQLEKQLGAADRPSAGSARRETGDTLAAPVNRSWVPAAVGWTAGGVAFAALAWLVMSTALRPRAGGDSMTGSLPGQDVAAAPMGAPVAEVDMEQLAALESVVANDPGNLEALVALGHLYLRLQRYDELNFVTQAALDIDPEHPEALTHLGMLLFSMNHPEGVIPTFDRALAADPNFAEALQFKGMVSFMRQDYATAVEAWEHYLEVVPAEEISPRIQAMLEAARASAGSSDGPQ